MSGLTLFFALCLALIHLGASRFSLATAEPRSRWLSLAGGASVAYVFVHILPELKKGQDVFIRAELPRSSWSTTSISWRCWVLSLFTAWSAWPSGPAARAWSWEAKTPPAHGFLDSHPLLRLLQRPGGLSAPAPGATGTGQPQLLFHCHGGPFPGERLWSRRHHKEAYDRMGAGCWPAAS